MAVRGDRRDFAPVCRPNRKTFACSSLKANARVKVFQQRENPGVGRAFREGYARVQGNVVLSMDSDGEMELATIHQMIDEMAAGNFGLVVGSRWLRGGGFVGYSPAKRWLNWGFQQLFRVLFRTRLHDLTYGFKLMRSELVRRISWRAIYQEIGCETTIKALWLGVPASEVSTTWRARAEGRSTNSFARQLSLCQHGSLIMVRGVAFNDCNAASDAKLPDHLASEVTHHCHFSARRRKVS